MIVVTGATGALNGTTVEKLLERIPAERIGVSVRDPEKARHLAERGVRVRRGSYDDPAALRNAFEGAEQVLLVSSNDPGADAPALHEVAIRTAVEAGAERILYTSHQGAGLDSPFVPAQHHAATEALLAESGVAWTSLRNGFYAHSLDWMLGPWQQAGVIATPAEGPTSWTERADAGEAAAAILAGEVPTGGIDGPVTLTALAAPDFDAIAATLTELTGRGIRREVVDDDAWLAAQEERGEGRMAGFLLGFYRAASEGRFAGTGPALAELLGREPRSVRDLLAERVAAL